MGPTDLDWYSRTFSVDQIKAMTMAEYAKYRDLLMAAAHVDKNADSITIKNPLTGAVTCMWCAAGPYPTIEELEAHEEACR